MKRSQPSPPWVFSLSVKGWWLLLCQNQILLKMQWSTWSPKTSSSILVLLVETIPVVQCAQEEELDEGEDYEGCFPDASFTRFMRGKLPKDSLLLVDGCGQLIPRGDTDMGQNLGTRMNHNNNMVYAPNMWLRIPYVYIYICIYICVYNCIYIYR